MSAALEVRGLTAGYAGVPAVSDFDLSLEPGEVLTLLGPNGAGKTTALLAMVGAVKPMSGAVECFGTDLTGERTERVARCGLALVPDDGGTFHNLTVAEHLRLARTLADDRTALDETLDRFPALRPLLGQRCGLLSGGEQRMLALAKVLMTRPRVLLIDEMSLGLAPVAIQRLLPVIREMATEHGTAAVLVEQHADLALRISDRALVLNRGRITLGGRADELLRDRATLEAAYFGSGERSMSYRTRTAAEPQETRTR